MGCFRIRTNETDLYALADAARIESDGSLILSDSRQIVISFPPWEWQSIAFVKLGGAHIPQPQAAGVQASL